MFNHKSHAKSNRHPVDRPTYSVNIRLLVGTLLALSAVTVAAYFWHGAQLHRLAAVLLDRAGQLEEKNDWRAASKYIYRYVRLRPNDNDARIRLAKAYDKFANDRRGLSRTVDLFYYAIGGASADSQFELRQRLAELLLQLGRFGDAEAESVTMLAVDSANPRARRSLAVALYGQFRAGQLRPAKSGDNKPDADSDTPGAASEARYTLGGALEQAIEANPDQVDLAVSLATVLREAPQYLSEEQKRQFPSVVKRQIRADQCLDQVVAHAKSAESHLARYIYRKNWGLDGEEDDLLAALELAPQNPEVLFAAATYYHERADAARPRNATNEELKAHYEKAEQYYRQLVANEPRSVESRLGLLEILRVRGDFAEGIAILQSGRDIVGVSDHRLALRLAEFLIYDNQLTEARQVLNQFDAAFAASSASLPQKVRLTRDTHRRWLEAYWLLRAGRPLEAIAWVHPTTASDEAEEQFRAWYTLGECYSAVGQLDRAAEAFSQAASRRPEAIELRIAAANAWVGCGQPGQAVPHLEYALSIANAPSVRLTLAGAHLQLQANRPRMDRDWFAFESQMNQLQDPQALAALEQPWIVQLLRVDRVLLDDTLDDHATALSALRVLEEKYPEQPELLERLVTKYEGLGATQDADRALEAYRKHSADPTALAYFEGQLLVRRGKHQEAVEVLEKYAATAPEADKMVIERGLVNVLLSAGRWEEARQHLLEQHRQNPDDSLIALRLGETCLQHEDFSVATALEQHLKDREGPDGSYWRYLQLLRLLEETKGAADPERQLAAATSLQRELQVLRPAWTKSYVVKGLLQERRQRPKQAIEAYQRAIELGEESPLVYERFSLLLYQDGRLAEAEDVLELLDRRRVPPSDVRSALAVSLAARQDDLAGARKLAERQVTREPDNADAWLRFGQVLLLGKQHAEAEQKFQKAAELKPEDVSTWIALFTFYVQSKQPAKARALIPQMESQVKLPEADRSIVLAQVYETLGDRPNAAKYYAEAASRSPDNVNLLSRMAMFYREFDPAKSEDVLRRILKIRPDNHTARRTLAVMFANRGAFDEVASLLENQGQDAAEATIDTRLRAALLIQQVPPELEKAEELLQGLLRDSASPTDVDRLLLAQIYLKQREASTNPVERDAKFKIARRQLSTLCARENPNHDHLRILVGILMSEKLWNDAEQWLRTLEDLAPNDIRTLSQRCVWLNEQDRGGEIGPLVEQFAARAIPSDSNDLERHQGLAGLGRMLVGLKLDGLAEDWLRRAAAEDPQYLDDVVSCLIRQKKTKQAVELCIEQVNSSGTAASARTLANALSLSEEDVSGAASALDSAMEKNPGDADLLSSVAGLRFLRQGRTSEAIELYRKALDADPNNLLTLNNLAVILAEEGLHVEALGFVERAIQLAGSQAQLLDTKGMVMLHAGKFDEASELLQRATLLSPRDPTLQFHLAVALQRSGQGPEARQVLQAALQDDLLSQPLTPTDKKLLAELQKQL